MDEHKWTLYVLVVSCVIVKVDGECSLTCSGSDCYILYPKNGEWKYNDSHGNVNDAEDNVIYQSPNCYKYIKEDNTGSCYDAQRKCEEIGSNITAINHREEYDQLTDNVLHILKVSSSSSFIVHVLHRIAGLSVEMGCATIYVEDGFAKNTVNIKNINCSSRHETNTIICEATDLNTEICPVTTTEVNPSSTYVASTRPPFSMFTTVLTNWSMQKPTSQTSDEYSKEQQSGSLQVPVIASVVTVTIIIIVILGFVFVRRRRRNAKKNDQNRVTFSNGVGVHDNSNNEQDSDDAHNLLYATNSLSVINDAYDVPNQDNPAKDVTSTKEYDLINEQSVYSNQDDTGMALYALPNKNKGDSNKEEKPGDIQPKTERHTKHTAASNDGALYENTKGIIQEDEREVYECLNSADNNAGKDVYAVPNKNKESSNQDLEKLGKVQSTQAVQPETGRAERIDSFNNDRPTLYENTKGNIQNENDVYDCLNASDMFSEYDGYNELAVGSDGIQSRISGAGIHQTDKLNVGTENDYGKLMKKDEQYSYVDIEINQENPCIEGHTYDKLQRN